MNVQILGEPPCPSRTSSSTSKKSGDDEGVKIRVSEITSTSAAFTWNAPSWERWWDPLSYQVEIRVKGHNMWRKIHEGQERSVSYGGVCANETYEVRMRCRNSRGTSSWWTPCETFQGRQRPIKQGGMGPNGIYRWDQNSSSVRLYVSFPSGTRRRDVNIRYTPKTIDVREKNRVLFSGDFFGAVKSDSVPWMFAEDAIEDGPRTVILHLDKVKKATTRSELWPCVVRNHPKIDMGLLYHNGIPSGKPMSTTQFRFDADEIGYDDNYFENDGEDDAPSF